MTPKKRKRIKICLVVLAISVVVMAVSTIVQVIHNGWSTINTITIVPFSSAIVVMVTLLNRDDK